MDKEKAIDAMWGNMHVAIVRSADILAKLSDAVNFKQPDRAGKHSKELVKEAIEIYTRLGAIAALEEIE